MFKKLVVILTLTMFSSNILAQEILMKCKYNFYTYITDIKGDKIYSANIKSREKKRLENIAQVLSMKQIITNFSL